MSSKKKKNTHNQAENNNMSNDQTEQDEDKAETALRSSFEVTETKDDAEEDARCFIPFCGLVFYTMAFLSLFCSFAIRATLSVTIVAMVNQSAAAVDDLVTSNATNISSIDDQCPRDEALQREDGAGGGGEFNWNRNQQGAALATYFYTIIFSQIPGGWLADRYGGKWLLGGAILLPSVISLLSPTAARIHFVFFLVLRVLSGLSVGFLLPALHALIARWSPPKNRSLVVSVIHVGSGTGIVVTMMLSGVLCDHGFAGGWPSVFYVFGVVGCLWSGAWFLVGYSSPSAHPRMSAVERRYWKRVTGAGDAPAAAERPPAPWRKILTSAPVWALAVAFFANAWGFSTLAACIPMFMHDVLGFDMTKNGVVSATPFLASGLLIPVGWFADWLRSPGRLSTNVVRKVYCAAGFVLTGCLLVLTGFTGCDRFLAVTLMFFAIASTCLCHNVVTVNQLDLAPMHAGKVMGLTSCFANLAQIASPHVVGALTYHRATRTEWQHVFYLAAGIYAVATVVFVAFGSGNRQNWQEQPATSTKVVS